MFIGATSQAATSPRMFRMACNLYPQASPPAPRPHAASASPDTPLTGSGLPSIIQNTPGVTGVVSVANRVANRATTDGVRSRLDRVDSEGRGQIGRAHV